MVAVEGGALLDIIEQARSNTVYYSRDTFRNAMARFETKNPSNFIKRNPIVARIATAALVRDGRTRQDLPDLGYQHRLGVIALIAPNVKYLAGDPASLGFKYPDDCFGNVEHMAVRTPRLLVIDGQRLSKRKLSGKF
jgi:hypothetical protein